MKWDLNRKDHTILAFGVVNDVLRLVLPTANAADAPKTGAFEAIDNMTRPAGGNAATNNEAETIKKPPAILTATSWWY